MGIHIGLGGQHRNWSAFAFAAAEGVAQTLVLGPAGFSGSISAFFRAIESLRGEDDTETRAARLVTETLAYAVAYVVATEGFARRPSKEETQGIVAAALSRAAAFSGSADLTLEASDLANPASFAPFDDAAGRLPHELRQLEPTSSADEISARFRNAVSDGLNRIRVRSP